MFVPNINAARCDVTRQGSSSSLCSRTGPGKQECASEETALRFFVFLRQDTECYSEEDRRTDYAVPIVILPRRCRRASARSSVVFPRETTRANARAVYRDRPGSHQLT